MAIVNWEIDESTLITNTTKIKDADNKLQANMDDLVKWVNSTDEYSTTGLKVDVETFLSDNATFFTDKETEFQANLTAWELEWNTELQSIVDDTVVVEW
jgi:hypothetical protein